MNECFFSGRLTNDPQIKKSKAGKSYCSFSIGVRKTYRKKGDDPGRNGYDFINLIAFGGVADYLSAHGKKGDPVTVKAVANQSIQEVGGKKIYGNSLVATIVEIHFSADRNGNSSEAADSSQVFDGTNFDDVDTSDISPDDLPF